MKIDDIYEQIIKEDVSILLETYIFIEQSRIGAINESVFDKTVNIRNAVTGLLKNIGATTSINSRGLIQYLSKGSTVMAKMLYYAIRGEKDKIEELSSSVSKEDVVDFFMKIDTVALQAIGSPLRIIDTVLGTSMYTELKKRAEPIKRRVETAIKTIEELRKDIENSKLKTQIQNYANGLRRIFELTPMKIKESTVVADIALPDDKASVPVRRRDKKKKKKKDCPIAKKIEDFLAKSEQE